MWLRSSRHSITDPGLREVTVEIGGPDNLSFDELAAVIGAATNTPVRAHVPLAVMEAMSVLPRPVTPRSPGRSRLLSCWTPHDLDASGFRRRR